MIFCSLKQEQSAILNKEDLQKHNANELIYKWKKTHQLRE